MAEQSKDVTVKVSAINATGSLGNASVRTSIAIELSPEAARSLNELMSRTGDSPSDLFRKALGLYKLAEEAKQKGKAVGIATTPEALETEFVGL
jgi:predicted transcriptional regulator